MRRRSIFVLFISLASLIHSSLRIITCARKRKVLLLLQVLECPQVSITLCVVCHLPRCTPSQRDSGACCMPTRRMLQRGSGACCTPYALQLLGALVQPLQQDLKLSGRSRHLHPPASPMEYP
jgi:hypothetical protein